MFGIRRKIGIIPGVKIVPWVNMQNKQLAMRLAP